MNPRMPYGRRYNYPHMKPGDVALWERFIDKFPTEYKECIYDQPLGKGGAAPEGTDDAMKRDWTVLTQWKADVIAFRGAEIDVIEVKPNAGPSAIGQVKAYAHLVDQIDGLNVPVRPVILTDIIRPDMEEFCKAQGVKLIIV